MKKYKHLILEGVSANFINEKVGYQIYGIKNSDYSEFIAPELVEKSNDWERLPENTNPILLYITQDGSKIFKGDSVKLFTISKDCNSIYESVHIPYFVKSDKSCAERLLCFISEENRDKYLENHAKKYSLSDIEKCYPSPNGYENRISEIPLVKTLFDNLRRLG